MSEISLLIQAERIHARRYAVKLILAPRSRYAVRWRALKQYHAAQVTKWEAYR